MPTGAGKSLVYQLAALLKPEGVTVVVSPLIALMKDQVDALRARGVDAAYVNSSQTQAEQRDALEALRRGRLRLVYAAPERLRLPSFQRTLREADVALLAVDEAHCVSQWGHDFRPDYLAIASAREAMGGPPCVALTATATPRVQDDIAHQLQLRDPARLVTGFNRPNLRFEVRSTGDGEGQAPGAEGVPDRARGRGRARLRRHAEGVRDARPVRPRRVPAALRGVPRRPPRRRAGPRPGPVHRRPAGHGRRHERLRDGRGPGRRPLCGPLVDPVDARELLPGGRAGRPRRGARDGAPPVRAPGPPAERVVYRAGRADRRGPPRRLGLRQAAGGQLAGGRGRVRRVGRRLPPPHERGPEHPRGQAPQRAQPAEAGRSFGRARGPGRLVPLGAAYVERPRGPARADLHRQAPGRPVGEPARDRPLRAVVGVPAPRDPRTILATRPRRTSRRRTAATPAAPPPGSRPTRPTRCRTGTRSR